MVVMCINDHLGSVCARVVPVPGITVCTVIQTSLSVIATVSLALLFGLLVVVNVTGTEVVVTSVNRRNKKQWCNCWEFHENYS